MARVYSYIRFSDAKQAAGASVERQGAYAAAWAEKCGLVLDTELSMRDEGLSAFHQAHVKKGALGAFLAAVEAGRVPAGSVLVVEGLDRLSRAEPIQAQAQLASIINAGISVVTASDGKAYSRESLKANPMDLVYSLLVMIRAHEESDTKSKRVRDAIRRQCQGWLDGSYRGMVKVGNTPSWLRAKDGRWEFIEHRAAAVRLAIQLFMQGLGAGRILAELHERGLAVSDSPLNTGHLVRLFTRPALVGEKHVELDGETYVLRDYFPALLDRPAWDALQSLASGRARKGVKGSVPSILTGTGLAYCGYCGAPLKAQNMLARRREDGTIPDADRRLQCSNVNKAGGCAVPQSCSSAPIERALMAYCSDIVNMRALFSDDASALPAAQLAAANARLQQLDEQLNKLTTLMLEADGPIPKTFVQRGRDLEAARDAAQREAAQAEDAVNATVRAQSANNSSTWAELASATEAMDYEARMRARQLVVDSFARIVVFGRGRRPAEDPPGTLDVLLVSKSGVARSLRIDKRGHWVAGETIRPTEI